MSRYQVIDPAGASPVDFVLEAHGAPTIVVPDAHLLFSGTFKRIGPDLLIEGGGSRALLPDYFAHEQGATLRSPDGAELSAAVVRSLSGLDSSWQIAQAGGGSGPPEIGTVRTISGTAMVQRGGTTQALANGEPIFRGDVVETGAGSSLGIILRDNTVFSLSASARMVMNELVYDPARTDNAMSVNLVQGAFVFITGQVAKTGTLAVTTPVATMGIRGTTPIVKLSTIDGSGEFSIAADPGGQVGLYTLTLPTGLQTTVASTDIVVRVSSSASFDVVTKSALEVQTDQQIVAPAYQVFSLIGQRGDLPSPNQHANNTGKGQGSAGFQYAFAVFDQHQLSASQLLDNTTLDLRDPFGDRAQTFEDILLRKVVIGGALGVDLDTTQPGVNRLAFFPENAGPLPVTSATQITLPTNLTQLSSATVVLQNQFPGDNLIVGALPPGITFTITFGSIHVNLSGVASAADYIAALQAIRFVNTSDNPSTTVREIDVTVTSVDGQTATATTFVTVEAINDPPVNHLPGPQIASEDSAHVFSAANGNAITISDPDAGTTPITTALSVQHGTLTISPAVIAATGVVVSGNGTGTLIVTGPQASINAALDGLTYLANADFQGADGLLVSTNDNGASGGGGALITISVGGGLSITSVNDAPQGHDNTIKVNEDGAVTLHAGDFGFSDPHDSPANTLLAVKITTLPGSGQLTLAGVAVAAGATISAADLAAGKLVWTPGHDDHGDNLASLTFQVQDNGGTANGGVDLSAPNTLTFNVSEVNDAPQGHDKAIAVNEDGAVTLHAGDFGFSDTHDSPANTLLAVKITTLPGSGHLTLAGVAVAAGATISAADLAAGKLVWTPGHDDHGDGLASLTFQVQDNGGTANGGVDLSAPNTLTFDVKEVNDAPQGHDKTITVNEDGAVTLHAGDFGFSDTHDSPANTLLAVKITTLPGGGQLTLGGVAVAAGATISAADLAAGKLVWTPGHDDHGDGLASLTFQVQDNGGTANGGVDLSAPNTLTFDVKEVNDAPQGHDKTITVNEDGAVTPHVGDFGFTDTHDSPANTLLAVKITTLPGSGQLTLAGVAVAAGTLISAADLTAGKVVWTPGHDDHGDGLASLTFQVQDNGGTANGGVDLSAPNTLTFDVKEVNDAPQGHDKTITVNEDGAVTLHVGDFGFTDTHDSPANTLLAVKITTLPGSGQLTLAGVAVAAGTLISAADLTAGKVVWTPGHDDHGDGLASLTFQVQDNGGTANGGVDLSAPNTLTFDVKEVNDAPQGHDKAITVNEDGAVTLHAADFGFSDPHDSPANTLLALKIATLPGSGQLTLAGVAVTAGTLISAADLTAGKVVWTPGHDDHGNGLASLTFQVQDNGGTANGGVDLSAPNTLTFDVKEVNDAPQGHDKAITVNEDGAVTLHAADFGFSDPHDSPANTLLALKIATLPGSGQLTLAGVAVTAGTLISAADLTAGKVVWTPGHDDHGNGLASLTFQVQDNGGTANGGVDLSAPNTLTFDVTSVNDAPVNSVPKATQSIEDHDVLTFSTANGNAIRIFDVDAGNADMQVTLTVQAGILKLDPAASGVTIGHNGTATVTVIGSQANINAALNGLRYESTSGDHDDDVHHDQLTITTSDLGHSGSGGPLTDTDTIKIEIEDGHHSSSARALIPTSSPATFTGTGSAVDLVDFSNVAFANTATVAFGADVPIDAHYAVDILSHFDSATRQIDLSAIFEKAVGAGAVDAGNVADHVQAVDKGGGEIEVLVDTDGPHGASAPVKIAVISGTAGVDHHVLGSSAGDVISVVFDQTEPAAHVAISHP